MENNIDSLERIASMGRWIDIAATLYGVFGSSPVVIGAATIGAIGLIKFDNYIYDREPRREVSREIGY